MLIISQNKNKTTETLELNIIEKETCKSIPIDKNTYEKFRKIINKKDDGSLSIGELKRLGVLLNKDMTKSVYVISELNSARILAMYSTPERAQKVLKEIIHAYENGQKVYEMPKDPDLQNTIM